MTSATRLSRALKEELNKPLPGKDFQTKLSPDHRRFDIEEPVKYTDAAVALIIWEAAPEKALMTLMKRTEYDGPHSGQVSFPGGKQDPGDKNLLDTAIRETREETGTDLLPEENLGKLSPLDIYVSGFRVHPFVFFTRRKLEFHPDSEEVSYLLQFPITDLLDESLIKQHLFKINGFEFEAPYFDICDEIVWGATSMILSEFKEILLRTDKKNPGLLRKPGE